MSACPLCGAENRERARFCDACGAPLDEAPAPREARKVVTVLFCDVAGYTAAGERLDPEALRRVQSRYFDEARTALERHGATVEKFIGDAVMAVFGIPQVHEDDALRAVRAALELRAAVEALGLEVRIGINTGEVVAGSRDALVTGDAVNVAARLEQAAEPGEVLLGEATQRLVRDAVDAEPAGPLELKGKSEPIAAWRVLDVDPGLAGVARRLDSPLVGRERERRLLRDAFERTVQDRACQLFTILGTAGVGKSRLVEEFIAEVADTASVLRGRCLPYGEGITYWPIAEIVRDLPPIARLVDDADEARLVANRLRPAIGSGEAVGSAEEIGWAVRKLFEALAGRQRLVAVFDDIHWAEPTLLDLLEHVADWSREAPILLVCLARPELLDSRPAWAGGKLNATSVLLEPLGAAEAQLLIDNLLGRASLDESVRTRLTEAAEGNPLFVEEMLAMLIDEGLLARDNGSWIPRGDLSSVAVPPTIRALLAARIDRLGTDERRVLECAAVEGKAFHRGAVAHLAPDGLRDEVARHLMTLVRKELIRPQKAEFPGDEGFRFHHLLIRDAAYEAISKEVRAELHERFAWWLEARATDHGGEYEEIVGYHLEQAYRFREALGPLDAAAQTVGREAAERLGAAGRRALARADPSAAANLLRRAVSVLPRADPTRLALAVDAGVALTESGQLGLVDELLSDAIAEAREAGDRRGEFLARLVAAYARALSNPQGMFEHAGSEARMAIEVFDELGDDPGLARAWHLAGLHELWSGRGAAAEEALERAVEYARGADDGWQATETLNWLTGATYYGPRPARDVERRLADLEFPGDNWRFQAWSSAVASGAVAMQGRFGEARVLRDRAKELVNELGLLLEQAWMSHFFAYLERLEGNLPAAETELRHGYGISKQMGETGYFSTTAAMLADVVCEQGRCEEAVRLTAEAEQAGTADDVMTQVLWRAARAKALARLGEPREGEQLAREAVTRARTTDDINDTAEALTALSETLRLDGREDEADAALTEALELYERKGNVVMAGRTRDALSA